MARWSWETGSWEGKLLARGGEEEWEESGWARGTDGSCVGTVGEEMDGNFQRIGSGEDLDGGGRYGKMSLREGGEEGWLTTGRGLWRRRWSCSWRFMEGNAGRGGAGGGAGGEDGGTAVRGGSGGLRTAASR